MRHTCGRLTALLLAALLTLTACGLRMPGTDLYLQRTEGTVTVLDGQGREMKTREDLGLTSGCRVETGSGSRAWLELGPGRLVTLDQNSAAAIRKEDGQLEIEVQSGSLFFCADGSDTESVGIRAAAMAAAVRGACGWVSAAAGERMELYLLDGTAECSVTEETGRVTSATLSAGETARVTMTPEGTGGIALDGFSEYAVPDFAAEEVGADQALCSRIAASSGLQLLGWDGRAAFAAALGSIAYHGRPEVCTITAEQRQAYAQVLREEIAAAKAGFDPSAGYYYDRQGFRLLCLAGLVDLGGGDPALLFGRCSEVTTEYGTYTSVEGCGGGTDWGIWEYIDGQAVKFPDLGRTQVYANHLYVGGYYVADPGLEASVYPFENGRIASAPSTSAREDWTWDDSYSETVTCTIDGHPATRGQMAAWLARWAPEGSLAGYSHGSDVSMELWGLSPAEEVLAVLEGRGPAGQESAVDRTVTSSAPDSVIRRTTLCTAGYPLEIYYEIPVFPEEGEGYRRINAFFQGQQEAFFAQGFAEERRMSLEENYYQETFYNCWNAAVTEQSERLVSVVQHQEYHMGGPHPWTGLETHTFRVDTGEELFLSDVADGTPEEIRDAILSAARQQDPAGDFIDFEALRTRDVDDFHFYVSEGRVMVTFDMYECTLFRALIEDITLRFALV